MPVTPTYGVRAQAAALGVQQARVAASGTDPAAALAAALAANATYAWWGDDLPASGAIASWTDRIASTSYSQAVVVNQPLVAATSTGRRAASFDTTDLLTGTLVDLGTDHFIALVVQRAVSGTQFLIRNSSLDYIALVNANVEYFNGVSGGQGTWASAGIPLGVPCVLRFVRTGATVELWVDGVSRGTRTLTGGGATEAFQIDRFTSSNQLVALAALGSGADVVARAAAVEAPAMAYYL